MSETTKHAGLSHLRVIDLTRNVSGPYCTKLLAGFGAEVIKIEPPARGDPMRHRGPFADDIEGIERSLPFQWFNTGKKSVSLDLRSDEGVQTVLRMASRADVLIENLGAGFLDDIGLSPETLHRANPRLVITSISNFGKTGPYRAFEAEEITLYAMSGLMNSTGDPRREPLKAGPSMSLVTAGLHAYFATMLSVYRARVTGRGDVIDVSVQQAAMDNLEVALTEHLHRGAMPKRTNDEHFLVPWRTYPCRDGYAAIMSGPTRYWRTGATVFEAPALTGPELAHMGGRIEHREEVRRLMEPWLMKHDKKDVYRIGQRLNLAWGYIASMEDVMTSPQVADRGVFVDSEHPEFGTCRMIGAPWRSAELGWVQRRAPLLGEHTGEVLDSIESMPQPAPAAEPKTSRLQPLNGVRVLDLSHTWAAPHAARVLADYGADVIKIEYPMMLDSSRGAFVERINQVPQWWQMNRNKRSIALDLKEPQHLAVFKDLVKTADVVLQSSRPGVMERLEIGYDVLRGIRRDVIVLSMSAMGATGPESSYGGYGGGLEPLCGLQSLTSYTRDAQPLRIREADVTNGMFGASAVMTALVSRQTTGTGTWIDLSQCETIMWLGGEHYLEYTRNGTSSLPMGNRDPEFAPQGCYPASGEDRWIVLSVRSNAEWRRFCEAIGRTEWADDPRFSTVNSRIAHHDELDRLISEWSSAQRAEEAMRLLQSAGIASGAVMRPVDLAADPHLAARGYFLESPNGAGPRYPGFSFVLSEGGGAMTRRGPDLGADNEAILRELDTAPESVVPALTPERIRTAWDFE